MNKRDRILQSSMELFCSEGFDKTKIIDIAIKAGVGKGTVYEYFKSKDHLFFECFKSMLDYYNKGFEEIILSNKPFKEKLYEYLLHTRELFYQVTASFESLHKNPPKGAYNFQKRMEDEREFLNQTLIKALNEAVSKGEIRADINVSAISYFVQITVMQMTLTEAMLKTKGFDIDDIINLIYQGIGQ